jgi:ATP-dependent Clp protease ATP-binding subunit ClpX
VRLRPGVPMPEDQSVHCSFCFDHSVLLFEGEFEPNARICGSCAAQAVSQTAAEPKPAPIPDRPSREARLASLPTPKSVVAHLDQYVIGQDIAKRPIALGVSNHFKRLGDCWDRDAPDPIAGADGGGPEASQ